jgi:hypothetical protein
MSDSGYWTSLFITVLVLAAAFFCLFLGASFFVFLYDRISVFELWNSPVWLKLKVPFIIIAVIAFLAGVILLARYQGQKELKAAQEYARAQGWGFSRNDTQGLKNRAAEILWDLRNIDLHYIRTVETGQRSLHLFDCSYKHEKETASRSYSHGVACLIQSERFSPATVPVDIVGRDWTEVMIPDKVDMGQSPFAEKFLVLSKNPAAAQQTVSPAIQAIMLEHLQKPLCNPVCVSLGPGGAVVLADRTDEPERLQELIDLARRIESAQ